MSPILKDTDTGARDRAAPPPEAVKAELERILASEEFVASDRLKHFLRFVVEETLAGRANRLKAYTIALEVLGRGASFDPQNDPVVRMEAGKLRRRLERYYLGGGQGDSLRIEIPKGGYAPTFKLQGSPAEEASQPSNLYPPRSMRRSRNRAVALGGLAIVGLVFLGFVLLKLQAPTLEAVGGRAALQERGPGIIILPFENFSASEADELFASGLTQELVTNLMRFRDLRVYSAHTNEQLNEDLSRKLDVRYVVEGSVRRTPDRLHLIVHLLEVDSGRYVWSEKYDRPLTTANIFGIQEQMAAELAGRLAEPYGIIHKATADLFRRHRPQTLAAYDCVLRTFAYRRTFSRELYASSRDCLEDTVRRDATYPDGWAMLAYAHLDEYRWYGLGPLYGQPAALNQALVAARRAKELDPDSVMSLSAYAAVQFYHGEFAEAESAQRRAVTLTPSNPEALAQLGWRLAFARDWDQGIGLVRQATQQSVIRSGWYYMILAFDDYRRGDYPSALADMGKAGEMGFFAGPAVVAMAQAQLGHGEEARQALDRAIALDPTFAKDPRGAYRLHHVPESLIDQFMTGLRKAGLEVPAA